MNVSNKRIYLLLTVITSFAFAIGLYTGLYYPLSNNQREFASTVLQANSVDYIRYNEVLNIIRNEYIDTGVNLSKLVIGSIKGMVEALGDGYTTYFDPEENAELQKINGSIYEGIGVTLKYNSQFDYTVIETPVDGFPAQEGGIMPGDLILKVNDEDMYRKRPHYVASKILGDKGTSVHISVYRTDEEVEQEFDIIRSVIDLKNIEYQLRDDGYAVIKIHKFTENSLQEFRGNWDNLVNNLNKQSYKGIILDLRNNPGGFVDAGAYVAEEFFPKDTTLFFEEDRGGEKFEKKANRTGKFVGKNVVVLINKGTASASEIVAGAFQDNKRALLIGEFTVGKGVEQKVIDFSDGSALHLVFRRWLTPSGRNFTPESPIKPDIEVDFTTQNFKDGTDPQMEKAIESLSQQ